MKKTTLALFALMVRGGNTTLGTGGMIVLEGADRPIYLGGVYFYVPNAAKSNNVEAMHISGDTDTPQIVFKTFTKGSSSVSNGGTITHGVGTTPTSVQLTSSNASNCLGATEVSSTTITVGITGCKTGNVYSAAQTVYWQAWY